MITLSTQLNLNKVLHDLEKMPNISFKWFFDNLLKENPEKLHLTNSAQEIIEHTWNDHLQK